MFRTSAKYLASSLLGSAICLFGCLNSFAQSADVKPAERVAAGWNFVIAPYFVGANINGTSQIGRLPATDLDVGTDTILKNLHFGGMIRLEAQYQQRFGALIDIAYMKLGAATDTPLTGGRVRIGVRQMIAEGMLSYRFFQNDRTWLEAIAGTRYWNVTLDVNANGTIAGNFSRDWGDDWWDPVIGARVFHQVNQRWSTNLRGDIGGFGVGSDFSWNLQGGIGYHFNDIWSAHAQYKALGVNFKNGKSGVESFSYDTITHGPLIGIRASF